MNVADALFQPVVPEDQLHPYFLRIRANASEREIRTLRSWADGFVDRDNKFVREFQTSFDSSFWELYVYAVLVQLGLRSNMTHNAPDFCVDGELVVEAVIASNPVDGFPQWAARSPLLPIDEAASLDLATLRLAQAVSSKKDKWKRSYSRLSHCRDLPFVIAVAPFEQPGISFQGTRAVSRVLWDEYLPVMLTNSDGMEKPVGIAPTPPVFKPSGQQVPLAVFASEEFADVSAVFFSSLATWTKVHAMSGPGASPGVYHVMELLDGELRSRSYGQDSIQESLVDGSHLYLNPNAARPIRPEPWLAAGVAVHACEGHTIWTQFPQRMLVARWAMRLGSDLKRDAYNPAPPENAKYFERAYPPDGVLFGGPAQVSGADQVMLCLRHGWTICSGRDVVDEDWMVMVKRGRHMSLHEYVGAADTDMFVDGSFSNRDEGISAAIRRIDAAP